MNYKPLLLFLLIAICSCEKNPFDYRTSTSVLPKNRRIA
jgi:hypothetical protein